VERLTSGEARAKNRQNFLAFWDAYPKHQAINEAERVFSEVVEGTSSRPGVDPVMLIAKARAYARNVDPGELEYVPFAHKWLREGRYDDADLFTDQRAAEKEWLRGCYQRCDVKAVENRLRVKMPRVNLPDELTDQDEIRTWYKGQCRLWIMAQVKRAEQHGG
jgi:hypothetical protein